MNRPLASTYIQLLIGVLSCFPITLVCQGFNTNVYNISVKEGLSQNTIQDILEDDNGFLWIGTQDGLNKYDGYAFKVYKSDPQIPNSIPNNYIKEITKDKYGDLWICTQNGLAKYVYKKDRFEVITTGAEEVNTIILDNETVFIGTSKGLMKADNLVDPIFTLIENGNDKPSITSLEIDASGKIWMGGDNGLTMVLPNSGQNFEFPFAKGTFIQTISYIEEKVWVASEKGLYSFDPDSIDMSDSGKATIPGLKFYELGDGNYHAISIFRDHDQNLWVGTQTKGLFKVDKKNSILLESNFSSELFKYSSINEIYEDYTQCLWVGTVEAGLYRINISNQNFRLVRTQKNDPNGLTSNIVRGLLKIDHRLWIATSRGLNLYNRKTHVNRKYVFEEGNPRSISSNDVKVMAYSKDGVVWVGTDNGLNRLNPKSGTFERYFAEDPDPLLQNNRVRAVKKINDGSLWVGTLGGGISVIDTESRKLIKSYNTKNGGIGDDNVMNIFETGSGEIYAATYGEGLFRLRNSTNKFEQILPDSKLPKLLTSIHQSGDELLWVGSYGDGFFSYDPKKNQYQMYSTDDGLSNDVVYAAIPHNNSVWISTNFGLNRYDRATGSFLSFNENDGIQSDEFNTNSFYQCYTGELFFGGVNGLTYFFPDSIEFNSRKPKPTFTELKIFNEPVAPDQSVLKGKPPIQEIVCDSSNISLAYYHNSFSIAFASLVYSNPEDSKYAYQLTGFDEDWIYTDATKRNVTYTNLNPGKYTFKVKASNGSGVWNDPPISLFVTIKPSIWQTLWFKVLIVFATVSLLALVVYRRINKVERRKRYLETKIQEHTKEISAQNQLLLQSEQNLINENKKKDQVFYILSHNVRAPLTTLVALLKNSDQLNSKDFEKFISDSSHQVSESLLLLDNAFYWSLIQFERLSLQVETFDIASLINENIKKFSQTSSQYNVSIEFRTESENVVSDRKMLSLILQNLLFNSIKFSQANTKIEVTVIDEKDQMKILLKYKGKAMNKSEINELFDEGINIHQIKSQNEKGIALGLIVSYKLAKHMNYQLDIQKQSEQNTLLLSIPH